MLLAASRGLLPRDAEGEPGGARVPGEARAPVDAEMIEHFRLGFANRTLATGLPEKNRQAGAELRGRLQRLGILRESGHEHLNGSLVIPIFDETGRVVGHVRPQDHDHLREGTPLHLYSAGAAPRRVERGGAREPKEIILCESVDRRADVLVRGLPERDRARTASRVSPTITGRRCGGTARSAC